jgi:hypothetical protein
MRLAPAEEAMTSGAVTLGDLAGKITMLEVACDRCERHGRLRVAKLIAQHGADMGLPELRHIIASDCPRNVAVSLYELCGIEYPQLKTFRR